MKRRIDPRQMEAWVDKLQVNMQTFHESNSVDPKQQLIFIRRQYVLLDTTVKVLNGTVYLVGCSHPQK
jgi:hypothetical protein